MVTLITTTNHLGIAAENLLTEFLTVNKCPEALEIGTLFGCCIGQ